VGEYLLGIDIGGTKLALALGDRRGRPLARWRRPSQPSGHPRDDVSRLISDCHRLLTQAGASVAELAAVGVSVPGPMDSARGLLLRPPNLPGWDEVPLAAWLADEFDCPVGLENDANAAALAEWRFGAGQGLSHLVYLTMSTGVGAGLVLDGRIYRGARDFAGEAGHIPVVWEGDPCACGQRGCLEAYVGGAAWTRHLRRAVPPQSHILALAGTRDRVSPEHVVAAALEGDAFALAEMDRFNSLLARGIVSLVFLLAPQAIILGTVVVAAGPELCLKPLRRKVRARLWPTLDESLQILPAALESDLPYRAALCVALDQLEA
jgi:glucokinase